MKADMSLPRRILAGVRSFLDGVRQFFVLAYNEPPGC
jgi:hypothetical protein